MYITQELGDTHYVYLEEENPDSITQISLAQVGVWLKLEGPISQFSSKEFTLGIEQRLAKLGKFDWLRFRDEITGLPDWETIESEQEQHIFSQISAHLNYATDKSLEGPDEPIRTLRNALISKRLQNEMCAWLNERELQRITDRISELERERDHPLGKKRYDFNISCQSIFKDWFLSKVLPVPQIDEPRGKTTFVPKPKRELIKSQYEQLFNKYYSDPNADPEEVKRVLNDKERWKNPSEYLRLNKKRKGITTADLKKRPGFNWIDPKGTAKD